MSSRGGTERTVVSVAFALLVAPAVFVGVVGALGRGAGTVVGGVVAVAFVAAAALRGPRLLSAELDGAWTRHRLASIAWIVMMLASIATLGRLAGFMMDPSDVGSSVTPSSEFMTRHSCFSAYAEGARFAGEHQPNIYAPELYGPIGPNANKPRLIEGLRVDPYVYPPSFILLPAALRVVTADFVRERMLWYLLDLGIVVTAMLALAAWIGGRRGLVLALLSPAVLLTIPTRLTLQIGNFQLLVVAISILGMILLARGRRISGAALLAFVTVGKLYPAMLVVYLLGRRRYRDVAWVAAFGFAYLGLGVALYGTEPVRMFLEYESPRLASGEAFAVLRVMHWTTVVNESVFGLVLKLGLLGVPGAFSFKVANAVASLFTVLLAAGAFLVGRWARDDRLAEARVWLGIIGLATLRAPFLPQTYGLFVATWLLAVVAASMSPVTRRWVVMAVVAWIGLNVMLPFEAFPRGLAFAFVVTTFPQAICWTLLFGSVIRELRVVWRGRASIVPVAAAETA